MKCVVMPFLMEVCMDFIEKQIKILNRKITVRITMLEKGIEDLKIRQREDEFVYGVGGAYRRKENAIIKREKEINELCEFVKQIKKPVIANEIIFSSLYCKECHNEILTEGRMKEDWHECPVCRKMIYGRANKKAVGIVSERYLE